MVCNGCHALVDVLVESKGREIAHLHCPDCRSDNLVKWDTRRKSCPRLPGRLQKGALVILRD